MTVPAAVAEAAGLAHGARVRGTIEGAPYRSALMKYSGVFHLGIHKATLAQAGVKGGDRVALSIEVDTEPLPTDAVPVDLARALKKAPEAAASFKALSPAVRRGFVKDVLEAKKPETRARRIAKTVALLQKGVPPRRTWSPR